MGGEEKENRLFEAFLGGQGGELSLEAKRSKQEEEKANYEKYLRGQGLSQLQRRVVCV